MEMIELVITEEDYPQLTKRYGAEALKNMAVDALLKTGEEVTEANLYGVLSRLESDLAGMFG